jgi:carbon-monoxide dehydrogenase large subunit
MTRCHPCVQGIGQALYEGVRYDGETRQLLTGSLLDTSSRAPTCRRRSGPPPEDAVADRPLGVKGIGESGTIGAPPTIVHAVLDALVPSESLISTCR